MMPVSTNQHARQEVATPQKAGVSGVGCWLVIGGILVIATLVLLVPLLERNRQFYRDMELSQFRAAIEDYRIQFGEYPPDTELDDIESHIELVSDSQISLPDTLATIDERETLIFWLSGQVWSEVRATDVQDCEFIIFDSDRISDNDGDGWLEYHDGEHNYFVLRSGQPMVQNYVGDVVGSNSDGGSLQFETDE